MNNLESRIQELEEKVETIRARNARVEKDKAWETSWFRIVVVSILTYLSMCLVFLSLGVDKFYLHAIVPTLGFVLSTQSLPFIKSWWVKGSH